MLHQQMELVEAAGSQTELCVDSLARGGTFFKLLSFSGLLFLIFKVGIITYVIGV